MTTSFNVLGLAWAACVYLANAAPPVISMDMPDGNGEPVNVTLYYESLCPACHHFVTTSLVPLWPKVKDSKLMTVTLLPYGNGKEEHDGTHWKFLCQHGIDECLGNILEACIIHHYPDTSQQLTIIGCIEDGLFSSAGLDWEETLKDCKSTGVDVEKISTCAKSPEGNQLEHDMALRTGTHKWVPWVLLDGVFNSNAVSNLLGEVCKAYKGTPPSVCTN